MSRAGWATGQQLELLRSFQPEYDVAKAKKDYKDFWPKLVSTFILQFPVIDRVFPGKTVEGLTESESEVYAAERLREWYRWRSNTRSRTTNAQVSSKDLKRIYHTNRTREPKAYEVFAELFHDVVKPVYDRACTQSGATGRKKLPIWHTTTKMLWGQATQEQQEAVNEKLVAKAEVGVDGLEKMLQFDGENTPESYQHFQNVLPNILQAALEPVCRKAGVMAMLTIVGPVPKLGGSINTTSLQFGDKEDTPLFSEAWQGHDSVFLEALGKFARKHVFSEEVCKSRSLLKTEEGGDDEGDDEGEADNESLQTDNERSSVPGTPPIEPPPVNSPPIELSPVNLLVNPLVVSPPVVSPPVVSPPVVSPPVVSPPVVSPPVVSPPVVSPPVVSPPVVSPPVVSPPVVSPPVVSPPVVSPPVVSPPVVSPPAKPATVSPPIVSPPIVSPPVVSPPVISPLIFSPPVVSPPVVSPPIFSPPVVNAPIFGTPVVNPPSGNSVDSLYPPQASSNSATAPPIPESPVPSLPPVLPWQPFGRTLPPPSDGTTINLSAFKKAFQRTTAAPDTRSVPPTRDQGYPGAELRIRTPSPIPNAYSSDGISDFSGWGNFDTTSYDEGNMMEWADMALMEAAGRGYDGTSLEDDEGGMFMSGLGGTLTGEMSASMNQASTVFNGGPSGLDQSRGPFNFSSSFLSNGTFPRISSPPPQASVPPTVPYLPNSPAVPPSSPPAPPPALPALPTTPAHSPSLLPPPPHGSLPYIPNSDPKKSLSPPSPEGGQTVHLPEEPQPAPFEDSQPTTTRRSGRAPAPSTRAEKLNLIGTNVVVYAPAAVSDQEDCGPPEWYKPACDFLKADGRLGVEWDALISKWMELEVAMSYGKISKGALPVVGRPIEWKDWTAKTHRGVRAYDRSPFILEPAELGMAIAKWWLSFQPPFRTSDGPFPKPIYSDPSSGKDTWATIRKSGPNGLVSVVTLMRWWGMEALFPSNQFKVDSQAEWRYMVYDIRMCIEEICKHIPVAGLKRKREQGDVVGKENKRKT